MADSFFDGPIADDRAEEIQRLREALEAKTRELEAQQDRYLRTVAEVDNVRQRAAREAREAKTRELEAQQDRYLRTVAEFDNVRKRAAREREEYTRYANESVLRALLPVLDNLDRALLAARSVPA